MITLSGYTHWGASLPYTWNALGQKRKETMEKIAYSYIKHVCHHPYLGGSIGPQILLLYSELKHLHLSQLSD